MRINRSYLIAGSAGLLFLGVYFSTFNLARAATPLVDIQNNAFLVTDVTIYQGEKVKWRNEDPISHSIKVLRATDSAVIKQDTLSPKISDSETGRTYTPTFNDAGNFVYRLDNQATISGTLTVLQATPSASPTNSATPTATATVTPSPTATSSSTATPTVTPTVTPTPTATASPTNTPSPTPTVSATASPTDSPTPVPTTTPTTAPTATPTITPTTTPSPSPTVTPTSTSTPTPTVTASPTATPTVTPSPTLTSTPAPTVAPTVTPSPTPSGTPSPEVLPAFSVFRRASCDASLVQNNTKVITDKLGPAVLKRGTWNVESLTSNAQGLTAQVRLTSVRTVNLLFGGNPFFGADVTKPANEVATFSDATLNGILEDAENAWCKR